MVTIENDNKKKVSGSGQSNGKVSLLSYRRARGFATRCGWPESVPFSDQDVAWQISANDNAMSARIEIRGATVSASVQMNYMGKTVHMVRLIFDGHEERSEGLVYPGDISKAMVCFQMHLVNMLHGPVRIPLREIA